MQPFNRLTGVAAALPVANVDTDMILPAAFLKTVSRSGLGAGLFYALRHHPDGRPRADFVLNQQPWTQAQILIALENFGCGSSREHAPWALLDFGVRCILAPSFADIFYNNCIKNSILPIRLPRERIDRLIAEAQSPGTAIMAVDLQTLTLHSASGVQPFTIDEQRRRRMLDGVDDIAVTLQLSATIADHEQCVAEHAPWLAAPGLAAHLGASERPERREA